MNLSILIVVSLVSVNIGLLAVIGYRKAYSKGYVRGGNDMARSINDAMIAADDPRFTVRIKQMGPGLKPDLNELRKKHNPIKDHEKLPFDVVKEEQFLDIVNKEFPVDEIDPFN